MSHDSNTVYVSDYALNQVLAVNATTGTSTAIGLFGVDPQSIAISPSGDTVYVADYSTGIVELINTATNSLAVGHINPGAFSSPIAIAVSPDGSRIYILEQGTGLLEAYSTTSPYAYLGGATTGAAPTAVTVSPDGTTAYVAGGGGVVEGYVDAIDTTAFNTATDVSPTVVIPIAPAVAPFAGPYAITISPDGSTVYVANNTTSTFQAIPTSTDVPGAAISSGTSPTDIAVSPDGKLLYISDLIGAVKAFATSDLSNVGTYSALDNPESIVVSPDGNRVYTANDDGTPKLRAFNVAKLTVAGTGQIASGTATTDFAVSIDDGNATVGDYSADTLTVDILNSASDVVATVPATLDATTGTVIATVATASLPVGVYSIRATLTDPTAGGIIVATADGFTVGALAATGVDATVPLLGGGILVLAGLVALLLVGLARRRPRPEA